MTEYYAPKSRVESENIEAMVWQIVQSQYSDSTVKWADILEHPTTGKFAVILPENWRDLSLGITDVDTMTLAEMEAAGWFPVEEL